MSHMANVDQFQDGVVILIDALGVKGIWRTQDPNRVLDRWSAIVKYFQNIQELKPSEGQDMSIIDEIKPWYNVHVSNFSDTFIIIITAKQGKEFDFEEAMVLSGLIALGGFIEALNFNFLLRGAISYGKIFRDEHLCIGPAIDDAASWYEKPNFVGVICTPHTSFRLQNIKHKDRRQMLEFLFRDAKIPLRDNQTLPNNSMLNWITTYALQKADYPTDIQDYEKQILEPARLALAKIFSEQPIDLSVKIKFENTLDLLRPKTSK